MTEEKYKELLHKEVDGIISDEEKHQLEDYLKKNPQQRNLYHEILKTTELRKQVIEFEPSTNLKKGILNSIDANRYITRNPKKTERLSPLEWLKSLNPGYGYAFAAGLIIGLVLYSVFITKKFQDHPLENTNFYGTIGIPNSENVRHLDQVSLNFKDVEGTMGLYKLNNLVWFDINLNNSEQCTMVLNFDQTKINFDGYKPIGYTNLSVENESERVAVHLNKRCQFLLLFSQKSPENTQIDMYITSASQVPFTHNFQLISEEK